MTISNSPENLQYSFTKFRKLETILNSFSFLVKKKLCSCIAHSSVGLFVLNSSRRRVASLTEIKSKANKIQCKNMHFYPVAEIIKTALPVKWAIAQILIELIDPTWQILVLCSVRGGLILCCQSTSTTEVYPFLRSFPQIDGKRTWSNTSWMFTLEASVVDVY